MEMAAACRGVKPGSADGRHMGKVPGSVSHCSGNGINLLPPAPPVVAPGGLLYALWSFVEHPFPMLDENPLLDLMDYHTPNFYGGVMLWYYVSP